MEQAHYIKRDISWLSFNHRVLQEAANPEVPLYERIKFLAIYSSNLDEFFRVRVASLRSFKDLKKKMRKELDIKPKKELRQIRKTVQEQQEAFGRIFREEILPALESTGVHLIDEQAYDDRQTQFAQQYFFEKVYPRLSPVWVDPEQEAPPFLKNKGLYFIVTFPDSDELAVVGIPPDLPRFVEMPGDEGHYYLTFLDDLIRLNLEELLRREIDGAYAVKLSRDAEMYIDDEFSGDLVEKIKKGLDERNIGLPTRFLYDNRMPDELLKRVKGLFQLTKNDLIPGARYHNFNDFFAFPDPTGNPDLHDEPLPPLPHPQLETADSLLAAMREKDCVLHFPYQRYDYVPRLIWEAAADPQVKSIAITLYRVASRSAVVEGLLHALAQGKEVFAFIEAKARFDEASNLHWGEEMEKAGAEVIYSYPGIKVHTKLLLIQREEEGTLRPYAYLGTGNFNEKTARLYTDHALLTADPRLAAEAVQVFDLLRRRIIVPQTKHLLVAPFTLRESFVAMIDREIAHARAGRNAYMILKMNSLEDPGMVEKLYEASQAGVAVKMIVRGICCLAPGVEGLSEHIEVISIVDRFLEHGRVYIFGNGGQEVMYTASADWMSRNLYHRVEVAMPIYDPEVYRELREIIDLQLRDNTKARLLNPTQSNPLRAPAKGEERVRAQVEIYRLLERKGK